MRSALLALAIAVAACGPSSISHNNGDGGGSPDSPPGTPDSAPPDAPIPPADAPVIIIGGHNFSCMGIAPPTTAPDPLSISGTITEGQSMTAASGAMVQAHKADGTTVGSSTTTSGSGSFTLSVPTGGSALDGYVEVQASGELNAYVYPAAPMHMSFSNFSDTLLASSDLGLAATVAGAPAPDSSKAFIGVVITDCDNMPIKGATVTFSPMPAAVGYTSGGLPSTSASATDNDGLALGFNAPAGMITVGASYMGVSLHAHIVKGYANGLTETIVHP
jgi:hypothetical protein